ncbi:ShlB/FhaC/HecB family hemolysin secretion/activation protein [Aquabacterium sp.]|uniref:ShlB/FhaC/HecB family hemolysin secretion/activation protein n=1 Tax=Aquabacterium sp. TaxID=1872578 RepID=UPI002C5B1297|nr:ShlB/FhaC/HecB family hemolysin secretion/activation protein [Aquabacterium sp.]HSW03225.1 ShlB/FhaC/HecB family hemolysin secretion/activation protein [Aquabacterium sp.]
MNRMTRAGVLAALLALTAVSASAQSDTQRVAVTDISIIGNTLLPQATLDAALAPYKGQRTMAELKQAAAAVQELYRQAGYGAVVTFLPEQAVAGGKLVIGVLEGRIARVVVLGNKQFSAENVRRSLPLLAEGQTPRVRRIDAQVQLANDNPARKLALTLEAGSNKGEVDAVVNVTEEPVSRWSLSADNSGSRQTGRLRLGLGYQHAALWDRDHQLSLQAQMAPEHPSAVRIFSGSYRVPLYSAGLIFNTFATYSNVDAGTTATAAGALQFNGKGRALGLSLTRLFDRFGEFDQRLTLSLEKRDYLNNCAIEGLPAGACGSAGESVTVHPLAIEYSAQRPGERTAGFNLALSHNLKLGGRHAGAGSIGAVRPGGELGFTVLRGSAYAVTPLGRDWRLNYRLTAQASADGLVPGEQFGLAGMNAVRGYQEREVTGDSGAAASIEVISPAIGSTGLRVLAFADGGVARNRLGTDCLEGQTRCTLASWGLGTRFALGASQWRFDVAQALKDGRTSERNSVRLHFQASLSFQ